MQPLFVTGIYRSGTTLIEKLLSNYEDVKVASQPFPYLFFEFKNLYYAHLGIERRYPLNDQFLENKYDSESFTEFLLKTQISEPDVRALFLRMQGYFGFWTPELINYSDSLRGGTLITIFLSLLDVFKQLLSKKTTYSVLGAKEIFCEEYIPYFLSQGIKVIHIIRDPRDIISSLNHGRGTYYTGKLRPILYTIRIWRKSVAYMIRHLQSDGYFPIRYETLVEFPSNELDAVANFLELKSIKNSLGFKEIKDQFGKKWNSNSSFDDKCHVSTSSLGSYKQNLDRETILYIEKLCQREFMYLDFEFENSFNEILKFDINKFIEPYDVDRPDFNSSYSSEPENIKNEQKRLKLLEGGEKKLSDSELKKWFLFKEVFLQLRHATLIE